jgi:hypothetical protein
MKKGKWVKQTGFFLGSGLLNPISSPQGYKAWLKVYPESSPKKYICIEFPLDCTQEEQREWLKYVNKHYKDLQANKQKKHKDIKVEWGKKSGRKEDSKIMAAWIKSRYKELKKDKSLAKYYGRFDKIQEELRVMTFGGIKNPDLSIERIKTLCYPNKSIG